MARAWLLPLSTVLAVGCAAAGSRSSTDPAAPVPAPVAAPAERGGGAPAAAGRATSTRAAWVDSVLATRSVRQPAAQMVWVGTLGDYPAADAPGYAA
ncbi:MAG: hypothetical protein ACK54B_18225, partial [Gemmatimonas sp.]